MNLPRPTSASSRPGHSTGAGWFPRIPASGLLFFCTIGIVADCFNFNASLAEIFVADRLFNASEAGLGILGAASALGYMLPCLAMGMLSERLGRRPMVLMALTGLTAVYLRVPHVGSLNELYVLATLRAAATSMLWPPLMAWMTEITESEALPRVLARYNMSWTAGILLGFGMAGWSFERFGAAVPFHLSAVLSFGLFIFVLLAFPREMNATEGEKGGLHRADDTPLGGSEEEVRGRSLGEIRLWIFRGLGVMLLGCAVQAMILYLTPKIVGPAVGENAQGMLQVARMAGQIMSFFTFSMTAAWHFRRWPLLVCLASFAGGLLVVAEAGPEAGTQSGYLLLAGGYGLVGLGFGIAFTLCAYYTLSLFRMKGLGSGIMETLIGAGGFLGPLIAGTLAERTSLETALLAALIPLAVTALFALPWEKTLRRG